jgi:hypothetical protein
LPQYAEGRTEWWRNDRRLKPEEIRAIMKKKGDQAAEAFREGLDHEVHAVRADKGEEALMSSFAERASTAAS